MKKTKDLQLENIKEDEAKNSDKDIYEEIEIEKEKETKKEKIINGFLEIGKLIVGGVKTVLDYDLKKGEIEINSQNTQKKES